MRFFEFKITESKGIFGRVPGDPYVHPDGRKAIFNQVIGLPDMTQGGGQFESPEARDAAIEEFEKNTLLAIAVTLGGVRLIDNFLIQ